MEYIVNDTMLRYEARGTRSWGENFTLLDNAIDLTRNTSWHEKGFTIENLFDESTFAAFTQRTKSLLHQCWKDAGLVFNADFQLDQYHTLVNDFESHLKAIEKTKLLHVD